MDNLKSMAGTVASVSSNAVSSAGAASQKVSSSYDLLSQGISGFNINRKLSPRFTVKNIKSGMELETEIGESRRVTITKSKPLHEIKRRETCQIVSEEPEDYDDDSNFRDSEKFASPDVNKEGSQSITNVVKTSANP